jgi:hypothetical protein
LQPSAIILKEEIAMRTGSVAALFTLCAACLGAVAADAASCREQLAQFEERLNESSLAADEPEKFAELAQAAEAAAELRDEQLCLQRVAELNAAVAAEESAPVDGPQAQSNASPAKRAPPKPPVLLEAAPFDYDNSDAKSDRGEAGASTERAGARDQGR